jgi:ABC-type branched-subunit amino acid transport system substrate-binding protein
MNRSRRSRPLGSAIQQGSCSPIDRLRRFQTVLPGVLLSVWLLAALFTSPAQAASAAPGVTRNSISIGVEWLNGSTLSVTGANLSYGNLSAYATVMANWINKHGGLGGRHLDLVLHSTTFSNYASNPTAEQQALCTDFTQDHHVFAAVTLFPAETWLRCLAEAHTIDIEDSGDSLGAGAYKQFANYYYNPATMSLDRAAIDSAKTLKTYGFFKGAKVGIVYLPQSAETQAEAKLKAALSKLGVPVVATAGIEPESSQETAAILRFQTAGVNRVLMIDSSGGLPFTFMGGAQSQGYHPLYGLNTTNNLLATSKIAPAAQLAGAFAVSWSPGDVETSSAQTPPALPSTAQRCVGIFQSAGYSFPGPIAEYIGLGYCGAFLLLQQVLKTASPNAASFAARVNSLGASYQSPDTYLTRFGPGVHDGASKTRVLRFNTSCTCFVYKGPGGTQ